jgi:DNA polymerase III epsilon subunit-like protein
MDTRILVVDLETTGLDPVRHSIVEIGAVWLSGRVGSFEQRCRVWDGAALDAGALRVNGLDAAACGDKSLPPEAEALVDFLLWSKASADYPVMLAGLNPNFDLGFLRAAASRAGISCDRAFRHRVLDLHSLAVGYALRAGLPVPSRGLYTDEIYALLDLEAEPKPHRALTGARKEAEAFGRLWALSGEVAA